MFKIKRVEIDGFWGALHLVTDLNDDVNIFIGRNGSGKTTFINFLEAALTGDLDLLESLHFREIRLWLSNKRKTRRISISRISELFAYDRLKFPYHHRIWMGPDNRAYYIKGVSNIGYPVTDSLVYRIL